MDISDLPLHAPIRKPQYALSSSHTRGKQRMSISQIRTLSAKVQGILRSEVGNNWGDVHKRLELALRQEFPTEHIPKLHDTWAVSVGSLYLKDGTAYYANNHMPVTGYWVHPESQLLQFTPPSTNPPKSQLSIQINPKEKLHFEYTKGRRRILFANLPDGSQIQKLNNSWYRLRWACGTRTQRPPFIEPYTIWVPSVHTGCREPRRMHVTKHSLSHAELKRWGLSNGTDT